MFSEDVTKATFTDVDDLLSAEGVCQVYERLLQYAEKNPGFATNRMVNDYKAKLAEYQQKAADDKEARMQAARARQQSSANIEAMLAEMNAAYAALDHVTPKGE